MGLIKNLLFLFGIVLFGFAMFMIGYFDGSDYDETIRDIKVEFKTKSDNVTQYLNSIIEGAGCSGVLFQNTNNNYWYCNSFIETKEGKLIMEVQIE